MKITRRQLYSLIRENLELISEAHDPGETVRVGDIDVLILGRYDVGPAPFYIIYNPNKNRKIKAEDTMVFNHKTIDNYVKNKYVTWAKTSDGTTWNKKPDRLKKLLDRGQLHMLNDFSKAKEIKVDKGAISFNTEGLEWSLLGIGFLADFLPGVGTAVSTAANLGSIGIAIKKKNYLGAGLGITAVLLPAIGDSLAILGKAHQKGAKLSKTVADKIVQGITKVGDKQLRSWLTSNASDLGIKITDEAVNGIIKALGRFKKALVAA